MPSWSDILRNLLVGLEQTHKRPDHIKRYLEDQDRRLRAVGIEGSRLQEGRATMRETMRAEITAAVAESRVRCAEHQAPGHLELPESPER